MNKSNNDNIKEEKTQLTDGVELLTEQDLEAVNGGFFFALLSGATRTSNFLIRQELGRQVKEAGKAP